MTDMLNLIEEREQEIRLSLPKYGEGEHVLIPDNAGTQLIVDEVHGIPGRYFYVCHNHETNEKYRLVEEELLSSDEYVRAQKAWRMMLAPLNSMVVQESEILDAKSYFFVSAKPYASGMRRRTHSVVRLTGGRILEIVDGHIVCRQYSQEGAVDRYKAILRMIEGECNEKGVFSSKQEFVVEQIPTLIKVRNKWVDFYSYLKDSNEKARRVQALSVG